MKIERIKQAGMRKLITTKPTTAIAGSQANAQGQTRHQLRRVANRWATFAE